MITLKSIILILFLFSVRLSLGQNYEFDKIVKNSFSTQLFPNQEWTNLFNSNNDSYHMQIYNRNDSVVSRIFDTKENQAHYFYIDKSDSLKLYFMETKHINTNDTENKFEFSEIKEKNGIKEVTFKILNDRDKKVAEYKLVIKETDKNYFSMFKLSVLETQFFNKIKPPINFIVLEANGTNTNGRLVTYKLESIKDIELNIAIPH